MRDAALIAAWTWGSVGMLGWALAGAIPLIIHLWSRRRFQETPWAAMDFLLAALRKHARRLRLEQLALLAVRMGLLTLFAIALADPRWTHRALQPVAAGPRAAHVVLVVDTSYSMSYRERDRTRLEAVQHAARALTEHHSPGDGYSLVLLQNPPRTEIGDPQFDVAAVRRAIDQLAVSHGGADLHATLGALEQLLDQTQQRYPQFEQLRMYWFTDLGSTTWDAAGLPECRGILERLSDRAEMYLFDAGSAQAGNLTLSALRRSGGSVGVGESARIEAEVRSYGSRQPADARVEFLMNGRVVHARNVRVPPQGSAVAAAEWNFDLPGESVVEARLDADAMPIDNRRWMVVPVRKSIQVLCIQGEPEAADYAALALNPSSVPEGRFQVEVAPESALLDRSLGDYDCVMMHNVARVSFDEAAVLNRYVAEGGGLIVVLGDLVQPDSYNRELGAPSEAGRLLPARLDTVVRGGERFFDPRGYAHPFIAPFRGFERAGLLTVPTWRYFRLAEASPAAETALAFDSGDAAVLAESIGRGRVILVATALSTSSQDRTADVNVPWSALPAWPSFPPLVHAMVHWSVEGRDVEGQQEVGTPLEFIAPSPSVPAAIVTLPDASTQRVACSLVEGVRRGTFAETATSGVYRVTFPESDPPSDRSFAVNLDTRESDLARTVDDLLPDFFLATADSHQDGIRAPGTTRTSLFRALLGIVAVMLVCESAMACWFGRRGV
jgi:hypothetical protein